MFSPRPWNRLDDDAEEDTCSSSQLDEFVGLVKDGNLGKLRKFLSQMKNINNYLINDKSNQLNPLHIIAAIDCPNRNIAMDLLLSMKDIKVDAIGTTDGIRIRAIHLAAMWGHEDTLKILIDRGSDLFGCDSYGNSAYDYASEQSHFKCVTLLESYFNMSSQRQIQSPKNSQERAFSFDDYECDKDNLNETPINDLNKNNIPSLSSFSTNFVDMRKRGGRSCKQSLSYVLDKSLSHVVNKNNTILIDDSRIMSNESDLTMNELSHRVKSSINLSDDTSIESHSNSSESAKTICNDSSSNNEDDISGSITSSSIYPDDEHGITLVITSYKPCRDEEREKAFNETTILTGSATADQSLFEKTFIADLDDSQIHSQLQAHGDSPGPIVKSTRKFYYNRLKQINEGITSPSSINLPMPGYCMELNRIIFKSFPFEEAKKQEKQLIEHFMSYSGMKDRFVYLLLDPNITENFPARSAQFTHEELFKKFVLAIYYVGKGVGHRPYMHLYEAAKSDLKITNKFTNRKIARIRKIWSENKGVVSHQCSHSISDKEALTRESLMMETIGMNNLTNIIKGKHEHIKTFKWNDHKRRSLGTLLLYNAFLTFLIEGEKQIKKVDLQKQ